MKKTKEKPTKKESQPAIQHVNISVPATQDGSETSGKAEEPSDSSTNTFSSKKIDENSYSSNEFFVATLQHIMDSQAKQTEALTALTKRLEAVERPSPEIPTPSTPVRIFSPAHDNNTPVAPILDQDTAVDGRGWNESVNLELFGKHVSIEIRSSGTEKKFSSKTPAYGKWKLDSTLRFDGEPKGGRQNMFLYLLDFLREWLRFVQTYHLAHQAALDCLTVSLEGRAATLTRGMTTIKEMISTLAYAFGNDDSVSSALELIKRMKQRDGEPLLTYVTRVTERWNFFPSEIPASRMVKLAVDNLSSKWCQDNISIRIELLQCKSLQAMRETAISKIMEENVTKLARPAPENKQHKSAATTATTKQSITHRPNPNFCSKCGRKRAECDGKCTDKYCYTCQKVTDHITPSCPNRKRRNVNSVGVNPTVYKEGKLFIEMLTQVHPEGRLIVEVDSSSLTHLIPLAWVQDADVKLQPYEGPMWTTTSGQDLQIRHEAQIPFLWNGEWRDFLFLVSANAEVPLISRKKLLELGEQHWSETSDAPAPFVTLGGQNFQREESTGIYRPQIQSKTLLQSLVDGDDMASARSITTEEGIDMHLTPIVVNDTTVMVHTYDQIDENALQSLKEEVQFACQDNYRGVVDRGPFAFNILTNPTDFKKVDHYRRIPEGRLQAVRDFCQEQLQKGYISEVTFEDVDCVANLVLVPKPDGRVRVTGDHTTVNAVTVDSPEMMPPVRDILDSILPTSRFFAVLDIVDAYWNINATEPTKRKLGFYGPNRQLFRWNVMPMGAKHSASFFQHFIHHVYETQPGVSAYADDLLLQAETWEELMELIHRVAQINVEHGLTMSVKKVQIGSRVKLLGWDVSRNGIRPDEDKVRAIQSVQSPRNVTELKRVLGMINFLGDTIPDLQRIVHPLFPLLRKNNKWMWTDTHQKALDNAKWAVANAHIIHSPTAHDPFTLQVDASDDGIGGWLYQQTSTSDRRLILCFSKSFSESQRNWPPITKEAYAVVYGVEKCSKYLLGRKFTLKTDHKPLTGIAKSHTHKGSSLVRRWFAELTNYDFDIIHVPGRENVVADALSRVPCIQSTNSIQQKPEQSTQELPTVTHPSPSDGLPHDASFDYDMFLTVAMHMLSDEHQSHEVFTGAWEGVASKVRSHVTHLSLRGGRLFYDDGALSGFYVPVRERDTILHLAHAHPSAGHLGVKKVISRLNMVCWWPDMKKDVEKYCASCDVCIRSNTSTSGRRGN